jgi:hypothetical protein
MKRCKWKPEKALMVLEGLKGAQLDTSKNH